MLLTETNTIRAVNLREYPKFWKELIMSTYKQRPGSTLCQILQDNFALMVTERPADRLGVVFMDGPNYSWFMLRWS